METLQDFVSARVADLTAAAGLSDWARHARNAVTSATSSVRSRPASESILAARPGHVLVGRELPLISPGAERC